MNARIRSVVTFTVGVLLGCAARADVVTLAPSKDNTLYESAAGTVSNGSGQFMFAGRTSVTGGGAIRRALVAFDVAGSVPAGSTINSVQLRMNMSRTNFFNGARTISLHRVLADWGEGASDAPTNEGGGTIALPGDATWLHTFFNTNFWASAGGDFTPTISASQSVNAVGPYTWASTAQMVADVQMWLDNPASDFGWVVVGDESTTRTAKRFDSRENFIAGNRPQLTIDFTAPPAIGACCDETTGVCTDDVDSVVCLGDGGRFGGDGSTCATLDPPCVALGACCDDSVGDCSEGVSQAVCEGGGSRYGGDGSTCATIDPACLPPPAIGACCDEITGVCTDAVEQSVCEGGGGRFGGDGSDCATLDPPCIGSGACCDEATGVCTDGVFESECFAAGFRYGGNGSTCATIDPPCLPPPMGACCVELTGVCLENLLEVDCLAEGGRFGGADSTCLSITLPCEPVITIGLESVAGGGLVSVAAGSPLVSPVRLTNAGDGSGRLFVVDQVGQIRIIKGGALLPTPFLDLSSRIVPLTPGFDERGLLGLAFHPSFATNGRFFVRYSAPRPGGHKAVVAEYLVVGDPATTDVADFNSESILFTVDEPEFNHNGGSIAFGPDGLLYFGLGDGGGANDGLDDPGLPHGPLGNGQNIDTPLGAVLRIDVDSPPDPGLAYHIPIDNPFVGGPGLDEIYAHGFRNPFTFGFDDGPGGDGSLYLGDVGQNLFEEVDVVVKGGNYGWAIREGAHCFDPFNPFTPPASCASVGPVLGDPLIDPVMEYLQPISCGSDAACAPFGVACGADGRCLNHGGISVIGNTVYRGSAIPGLVGKYVFGDFDSSVGTSRGRLYYFDTTGLDQFERREFVVTPDGALDNRFLKGMGEDESGELYVCVSQVQGPTGTTGEVFRITRPLPTATGAGARYLAVTLPSGADPVGIVVTPDCPGAVGQHVGTPGDPSNVALLVSDPGSAAFLTPAAWGQTVRITAEEIIPDTTYRVQLDSGTPGSPALSPAVKARTAIWGDAAGFFVDGMWEPPDASVDIGDIIAILQSFIASPTAPPIFRTDMTGPGFACLPDRAIDIVDVFAAINGFQNISYALTTGCPVPCP